ncbi:hypothetical protein ABZ436_05615 [Micromonospora matsumotoense]|uniref:hypothetical protein n=1 Tax=Micromonospora matsumotoense TaxID=121616 RepID=UPI0033FE660A
MRRAGQIRRPHGEFGAVVNGRGAVAYTLAGSQHAAGTPARPQHELRRLPLPRELAERTVSGAPN